MEEKELTYIWYNKQPAAACKAKKKNHEWDKAYRVRIENRIYILWVRLEESLTPWHDETNLLLPQSQRAQLYLATLKQKSQDLHEDAQVRGKPGHSSNSQHGRDEKEQKMHHEDEHRLNFRLQFFLDLPV